MLDATLKNFQNEIKAIREYIQYIHFMNYCSEFKSEVNDRNQVKILEFKFGKYFRGFGSQKRIFEYKSLIISLYGLLEGRIDIWIKEYLHNLSNIIKNYNSLSENLRNKHFDLSLKLITLITTKDYAKFQHLNKEEILKNINTCLVTPDNFLLNKEAFTISAGNLKHSKICDSFGLLDVSINDGFKRSDSFKEFIGRDFTNTETDITFSKINELVDRRNSIAHGSERIDDILDSTALISYVDFLEKYCETIFEILREELVKMESVNGYYKIVKILHVWNYTILGCELENYEIKVGDELIVKTAESKYFKKKITSIQINKISYDSIAITAKTNVGIKVDSGLRENQEFFLIRK